jgi:hypothetical protein
MLQSVPLGMRAVADPESSRLCSSMRSLISSRVAARAEELQDGG